MIYSANDPVCSHNLFAKYYIGGKGYWFNSQDLIRNSPYCLPNNSHYVSLKNLVLNQLVIL